MKQPIALFLLLLIPWLCIAQADAPFFAYVRSGATSSYDEDAGSERPEYAVVRAVFEDLVAAQGNRKKPEPRLFMPKAAEYVAWMDAGRPAIGLETKAYDVCRSFGADSLNAVAALLAHELIHYYESHAWSQQFAAETESDLGAKVKMEENSLSYEAQADELGGFLAYAAGYPTFGLMPELLERLYEAYELDSTLKGYPSLAERQKLARAQDQKVEQLSHVYEASILLTTLNRFDDARLYLRHITNTKDFQSRDLFNNLGVLSVLEAIPQFQESEVPFGLPVELDAQGRLDQSAARSPCNTADCKQARTTLLESAIEDFDRAVDLDPDYATAFLNKAIAYHLLDRFRDAKYFAITALDLAEEQQLHKGVADAWILLGAMAAEQGNQEEALENFEKAKALNSSLAEENIRILKKEMEAVFAVNRNAKGLEMVDSLQPENFLRNPMVKEIPLNEEVILGVSEMKQSTVLFHFADNGRSYAFFHLTKEKYDGQTVRGIKIGDSEAEVINQYKAPHRRLELRRGTALVYPVSQLIFFLDESGKIRQWAVFRQQPDSLD